MSANAASDVIEFMGTSSSPVLCAASGDTPAGVYEDIVRRVNEEDLNIQHWSFVGLDEWAGMNGQDEGSCRYYLDLQLFHRLEIPASKICFFDGRATDLGKECVNVEDFIARKGGIQVAVLGLGMNGHIGMNEPGSPGSLRSHVSDLDPITKQVGQKYFKKQQQLTKGITLGLATLMEAKYIILLVSGEHKSEIVKQMLTSAISERLPCTLLRNHPRLRIHLDKGAAKQLF